MLRLEVPPCMAGQSSDNPRRIQRPNQTMVRHQADLRKVIVAVFAVFGTLCTFTHIHTYAYTHSHTYSHIHTHSHSMFDLAKHLHAARAQPCTGKGGSLGGNVFGSSRRGGRKGVIKDRCIAVFELIRHAGMHTTHTQ